MNPLISFFRSSIGKKWIVALTGLVLIGYVIGHLIGNLQIFSADKSKINEYGAFLHSLGGLLWAVRIFLLACFVLHIVTTILLVKQNSAARPQDYAKVKRVQASPAGRTMIWSGLVVLCFVIYHILHFTTHTTRPEFATLDDAAGRHDVYQMVVLGFQNPFASGFYILGMFLLCMHLSHGFGSFFQTLGLNSKKSAPWLVNGGRVLAWLIFIGYVSIPISVMTGFLHL
jgi:succinate dehydrogenase / fumarate reductase, cytochrome b subunit